MNLAATEPKLAKSPDNFESDDAPDMDGDSPVLLAQPSVTTIIR
jgi:hypothetical protein